MGGKIKSSLIGPQEDLVILLNDLMVERKE